MNGQDDFAEKKYTKQQKKKIEKRRDWFELMEEFGKLQSEFKQWADRFEVAMNKMHYKLMNEGRKEDR